MQGELRIVPSIPTTLPAASIHTFADLFCGIGGFHYAAQRLGLRCVFASDIDTPCRDQYERNFAMRPYGDIKRIPASDIPDHDILFAGFPCQPFSIIGDRRGLGDARGTLVDEIVRVLKEKRPTAFVLENVRQFASMKGGAVLESVIGGLADAGYTSDWRVLNALDFGLPQKRERIIIVGFLDDSLDLYEWPNPRSTRKALSEILETNPDRRHFVSSRIRDKRHAKHAAKQQPAIWHENKAGNISSHPFSCALRANASYNYLLVDGERRLTPREQLRLQGFPERFDIVGNDSQIKKQAGNAVPVPMVQAVIKEVVSAASQNAARYQAAPALSA